MSFRDGDELECVLGVEGAEEYGRGGGDSSVTAVVEGILEEEYGGTSGTGMSSAITEPGRSGCLPGEAGEGEKSEEAQEEVREWAAKLGPE